TVVVAPEGCRRRPGLALRGLDGGRVVSVRTLLAMEVSACCGRCPGVELDSSVASACCGQHRRYDVVDELRGVDLDEVACVARDDVRSGQPFDPVTLEALPDR